MQLKHTPGQPLTALAPMADVTDAAFRRLMARYSKPDLMWTEFVSADGLYHTRNIAGIPDEQNPLMLDLRYHESERPIIAQVFTAEPSMAEFAGALVRELGFDGVDINMGCPDRAVIKQGAGAALIQKPTVAREIIRALRRGAGELPIFVKTRIGSRTNELPTWLPELLAEQPYAVTIHARTRSELSRVPARWEHVREAVAIRNMLQSATLIIGNGDIHDLSDAHEKAEATGADGVMVGRASFGNPWLFSQRTTPPSLNERLQALDEHLELWDTLMAHKSYAVMRKHFKAYLHGFEGAHEMRGQLMETLSPAHARALLQTWKATGGK